jgi:hypothetical protein
MNASRIRKTNFDDEKHEEVELEHGVGSEEERQRTAALARRVLFKVDTR